MAPMPGNHTFLLILISISTFVAIASEQQDLIDGSVSSKAAMDRLRDGEILVENVRTEESGGSVRIQAMMHGDVQALWDFLASCDSAFLYVDGLRNCEVLSVEQGDEIETAKLQQSVKKSWVIPKIEYVIEVRRQPLTHVDFRLVEGNLKNMDGGWRFRTLENEPGFIVTHEVRVRPSFPVPRWLIRRSMRKDTPDMLACLRGLVNGSGNFSRDSDLGRCPKPAKRSEAS